MARHVAVWQNQPFQGSLLDYTERVARPEVIKGGRSVYEIQQDEESCAVEQENNDRRFDLVNSDTLILILSNQ